MTPEERMDEARCQNDILRKHLRFINEFGVSILHVMEGDDPRTPGWSYTIGLWHKYRRPEVIVIGLESGLSQILLNNLNFSIREEGRTFWMVRLLPTFSMGMFVSSKRLIPRSMGIGLQAIIGSMAGWNFQRFNCCGRILQESTHGITQPMNICVGFSRFCLRFRRVPLIAIN